MDFNIEQKEFTFSHPLKQSTKNRASWVFTGDVGNIDKMTSSCGCTSPVVEGNEIIAYYNAPNRQTDVRQVVTVWLKDGQQMETINPENGQKIKNRDKAHIDLVLKGTVE